MSSSSRQRCVGPNSLGVDDPPGNDAPVRITVRQTAIVRPPTALAANSR